MKFLVTAGLALASLLAAAPALAAPMAGGQVCVDPTQGVNSRWLKGQEIYVTPEIGKNKPQLRLTLDARCFNLDATAAFRIHSATHCIARGDTVLAQNLGDRIQRCRITNVVPYAPEKGDRH